MNSQWQAPFVRCSRYALGLALVLAGLGSSLAHEALDAHLAGLTPCVDEGSVHIDFVNWGEERTDAAQLARDLASSLEATFSASQVGAEFASSCSAMDAYFLLYVRISSLAPDVYALGDDAYGYTLSLQAGGYADRSYVSSFYKLVEPSYTAFEEEIYLASESDITVERHVVVKAQRLLANFALTWREDNPEKVAPRWLKVGPQQLGILLSLCAVATGLFFGLNRRRS